MYSGTEVFLKVNKVIPELQRGFYKGFKKLIEARL